jgi:hypothetical protein
VASTAGTHATGATGDGDTGFLDQLEKATKTVGDGASKPAAWVRAARHWGGRAHGQVHPTIHGPEGAARWRPAETTAETATTGTAATETPTTHAATATFAAAGGDPAPASAPAPAADTFSSIAALPHGPVHQMPNPGHIVDGTTREDQGRVPGTVAMPLSMIPAGEVTDGDVAYAMQQFQAIAETLGQLNAAYLAPGELNTSFGIAGE